MKVRIKKLNDNAKIPVYSSKDAAGADLCACIDEPITVGAGESVMIPTGLSMELPENTVGLIFARSGLASKRNLAPANKVGVIDSDYRGEVKVCLFNHGKCEQRVEPGERIAQLAIVPYIRGEFELTDTLSDTERGEGGFGSTGRT